MMHELLHFPMRGVPLFNERQVRQLARLRRETMFSYTFRELKLPPIRDTQSLVGEERYVSVLMNSMSQLCIVTVG